MKLSTCKIDHPWRLEVNPLPTIMSFPTEFSNHPFSAQLVVAGRVFYWELRWQWKIHHLKDVFLIVLIVDFPASHLRFSWSVTGLAREEAPYMPMKKLWCLIGRVDEDVQISPWDVESSRCMFHFIAPNGSGILLPNEMVCHDNNKSLAWTGGQCCIGYRKEHFSQEVVCSKDFWTLCTPYSGGRFEPKLWQAYASNGGGCKLPLPMMLAPHHQCV